MDREAIRKKYLRKRKLSDMDLFSMIMELFINFVKTPKEEYLFTQDEIDKAKSKTNDLNHAELLYVSMIELHNKRTTALHQFSHGYWRAKAGFLMLDEDSAAGVENIRHGRFHMVNGLNLLQACDICLSVFCDVYKTANIYDRLKVDFSKVQIMLDAFNVFSRNEEIKPDLNGYEIEPVEIAEVDRNTPAFKDVKNSFLEAKKNKDVLRIEFTISKIIKGVL